jgi:hypothetical protein
MTLNITYKNGTQQEFHRVRMTTVYVSRTVEAVEQYLVPQLVIHFSDFRPQINKDLDKIHDICTVDNVEQERFHDA